MTKDEEKFLLSFGLKIRRMREERGWSLEYTEEKGWTAWQYLQRIETGKQNPSLLTLWKLSKLFSIPISDLLKN